MSHCDRILQALRDGTWKTTATLYREVGPCILHSRISDLRKKGHNVEGRSVPGRSGADGYEYRLVSSVTFVEVPRTRQLADPLSPSWDPTAEHAAQLALHVAPAHYDI